MSKKNSSVSTAGVAGMMWLMACFGAGSAYLVLTGDTSTPPPKKATQVSASVEAKAPATKLAALPMQPVASAASLAVAASAVVTIEESASAAPAVGAPLITLPAPASAVAPASQATAVASQPLTAPMVAQTQRTPSQDPAKVTVQAPVAPVRAAAPSRVAAELAAKKKKAAKLENPTAPAAAPKAKEIVAKVPSAISAHPAYLAAFNDVPKEAVKEAPKESVHAKSALSPSVDTPKPITAEPLVRPAFKPVILTANQSKVWVRIDERKTVIFNKGETVPGFGVFKDSDGKTVTFDSGTHSIH